jgi:hypothetical protein
MIGEDMHSYTTDSSGKKFVPLYIAALSVLAAWILNRVLGTMQFTFPWWIGAPSVIGFYGVLYAIFDKRLWRWRILRTIGVVKVPDLNGIWNGYVVSSFDEHATKYDATLKISQNWTQISVILKTNYSKSSSLIAAIVTEDPCGTVLSYEYLNEPMPNAKDTMHTHRGTARLTMQSNGKALEGEYYTGRDRQNFGILRFERT